MKTAILIKDGEFQVVLTPEDGFEKNLLSSFATKKLTAKVEMGSFYKCIGGWTREGSEDSSLIVNFVE